MQQNNLTTTMQNFGKLTAEERALFLSVISAEKVAEKTQKRKKSSLPFEYTKEYYEQYLKKVHNTEVKARLERISAKQRNQTTGISQGLTH